MPRALQARVAARGYPVANISGQSGQGALPDSTLPAAAVPPGTPAAPWTDPNIDPASVPAAVVPPEEYVLGATMWGLSGAPNPDDTPRTHAAPMADRSLPVPEFALESDATHSDEFTGWKLRMHPPVITQFGYGEEINPGSPPGPLQKVTGQIRVNAGMDGVQGYGGQADGINGTNATMELTTQDFSFPGPEGGYAQAFVSAGEVPFLVPSPDQFIQTAPEYPAYVPTYDGTTAQVSAQSIISGDTPLQGAPVAAGPSLLPAWGSLNG